MLRNFTTEKDLNGFLHYYSHLYIKRFMDKGLITEAECDDIRSEVGYALANAYYNYEPRRKIRFSTFAVSCIFNSMKSYAITKRRRNHKAPMVPLAEY